MNTDTRVSSSEGFKRVGEWLCQIKFLNTDTYTFAPKETFQSFEELEATDPITLLSKIQNGTRVTRDAVCEVHGQFVLAGWHFDNWIAWAGREQTYCSGWTGDEGGCHGCYAEFQAHIAKKPEFKGSFPRLFALETPAMCPTHGPLILKAEVRVYPDGPYIGKCLEKVNIDEVWMGHCPQCESEMVHEMYVCDSLGLSNKEWALRGAQVMAALEGEYE